MSTRSIDKTCVQQKLKNNSYYYEYRARHFNFFHVYCARSISSVLKIAVVASNCFGNFKIAEKCDADWKPDVNCHQKSCEGTAVDLEIAEKLGRMKHHFVSTKDVGKRSTHRIEP